MSVLDRINSYVSHLFDSTPPTRPSPAQRVPITVIQRPNTFQPSAPIVPSTQPQGSVGVFRNPPPRSSSQSSNNELGATILGGIMMVGGGALALTGAGTALGGVIAVVGFGILSSGCGSPDESPNFNANVPEASVPATQDQWCEGVRSLTAAPITDASPLINRFPGISADLRNLPRGMSAIGIAPQDISGSPQYAYVLVQNRRRPSEREATEQSTYILLYERNAEGQYLPRQIRENDALGTLRNVAHFDSLDADSITYVSVETFRQNTQRDGAPRVNLLHPGLTDQNSIVIRFENGQVTIIPYGQTQPAGGADVCSFYGQSRTPNTSDAGVGMDAVSPNQDVPVADARPDTGMDARSREGGVDASADIRREASTDAPRDTSSDRPADANRDAGRDTGVDAAADARADARSDARD